MKGGDITKVKIEKEIKSLSELKDIDLTGGGLSFVLPFENLTGDTVNIINKKVNSDRFNLRLNGGLILDYYGNVEDLKAELWDYQERLRDTIDDISMDDTINRQEKIKAEYLALHLSGRLYLLL